GCGEAEEAEYYFDEVVPSVEEKIKESQEKLKEFVVAIINEEPEEAIDILSEGVIPLIEERIEIVDEADLTMDELVTIADFSKEMFELELERHIAIRDILVRIMSDKEAGELQEEDINKELDNLSDIISKNMEVSKDNISKS